MIRAHNIWQVDKMNERQGEKPLVQSTLPYQRIKYLNTFIHLNHQLQLQKYIIIDLYH